MQFYTTDNIPANLAQRSFAAGLTRVMPNGEAPLLAMTGYAQKKIARQVNHGYWTKTAVFPQATVNKSGGHTSGETVLTIDATSNLVPGMILRYQPAYGGSSEQHTTMAELMYLSAVNSSTELVVQRGFGGTSAAAVADDSYLVCVGNAHEQGSDAPIALAVQPVLTENYTQIFRDAWDITGTLNATEMEAGYNTLSENKMDCAAFHAQNIEKAILFGKKVQTTKNGRPLFTMDGIEHIIQQKAPAQLWNMGSTTTYAQLETAVNPVFDYTTDRMNGNARLILCGGTAKQVLNDIGRLYGTYQLVDGQTGYGLKFSQFRTSRGYFDVIEHPLLNTTPDWKKMAIILETSSFDLAYLKGRDTRHDPIGPGTGRDAEGGVLTSELTVELRNPMACAVLYNLRAAA